MSFVNFKQHWNVFVLFSYLLETIAGHAGGFEMARVQCIQQGHDLAVLKTKEDLKAAHQYCVGAHGYHCWVGLRSTSCIRNYGDYDREQWSNNSRWFWVWLDDTELKNQNDNEHWCEGYPQTYNDQECDGGKFVYIDYYNGCLKNGFDGRWGQKIDTKWWKYLVCQHDINNPGVFEHNIVHPGALGFYFGDWTKVATMCSQKGKQLASIHSEDDFKNAFNFCKTSYGSHCWVGLYADKCIYDYATYTWTSDDISSWKWYDNTDVDYALEKLWCQGYPRSGNDVFNDMNHSKCDAGRYAYMDIYKGCLKNGYDGRFDAARDNQWFKCGICNDDLNNSTNLASGQSHENEYHSLIYAGLLVLSLIIVVGILYCILNRRQKGFSSIQDSTLSNHESTSEDTITDYCFSHCSTSEQQISIETIKMIDL